MGGDETIIKIPKSLYKKIEEKLKDTEFKSVSEYATHLLREALEGMEEEPVFSKEEEEKVKERLRALGYLD